MNAFMVDPGNFPDGLPDQEWNTVQHQPKVN